MDRLSYAGLIFVPPNQACFQEKCTSSCLLYCANLSTYHQNAYTCFTHLAGGAVLPHGGFKGRDGLVIGQDVLTLGLASYDLTLPMPYVLINSLPFDIVHGVMDWRRKMYLAYVKRVGVSPPNNRSWWRYSVASNTSIAGTSDGVIFYNLQICQ
jgi:hypothetical protein